MRPLALHIGPYGDVLRTPGRFSGTSSGSNFAEWGYTTHFTELSFTFLQTFVYYARKHFFIQVFFFIKIFDVVMSSYLTFATTKVKIKLPSYFFSNSHGCPYQYFPYVVTSCFDQRVLINCGWLHGRPPFPTIDILTITNLL